MTSQPSPTDLDQARDILRRHWGFSEFRPTQERAVQAVLAGRDMLVVMPTGGGKSICYQVPSLLREGVTVVVSPLISLMKDQVDGLRRRGVRAALVNSTVDPADARRILDEATAGTLRLLYVTPERFETRAFRAWAERSTVSLLAIDEAHCISEWGHDFRPAYRTLGAVRTLLGDPPVVALTATATGEVREDIVRLLGLRDPVVQVAGFDRRNLTYSVVPVADDSERDRVLVRLVRGCEGPGIVYAATRKAVDTASRLLRGVGVPTLPYHGGMSQARRREVQDRFMEDEVRVVVATNAFGMGIDKPDVRLVVHYQMPATLEAYYQEAGRAGRDGLPSDCVLLHRHEDRYTPEFFVDRSYPPKARVREVYEDLRDRAGPDGAVDREVAGVGGRRGGDRRAVVAFLERHGVLRPGDGPIESVEVRMIASPGRVRSDFEEDDPRRRFLRSLWRLGGGQRLYGGARIRAARLVDDSRDLARRLDELRRDGIVEWRARGGGDGWTLTAPDRSFETLPIPWQEVERRRAAEIRKIDRVEAYAYVEECRRRLLLDYFGDPEVKETCGACDRCEARSEGTPAPIRNRPTAASRRLAGELRRLRRTLARRENVPAYRIASDATLSEIARRAPRRPDELLAVPGVGTVTLNRYGGAILRVVVDVCGPAPEPPAPAPTQPGEEADPVDEAEASERFQRLRAVRRELAGGANLPAYCVFPDRTLMRLARSAPRTRQALLEVPGIGPKRAERWGDAILAALGANEGGAGLSGKGQDG